jgi:kinesin family protein 5
MVPRAFEEVLTVVVDRREFGLEVDLAMSYVEVFGQEMFDLLREGAPVGQSRVAGQRYVLDGGCSESVDSLDKVGRPLLRVHYILLFLTATTSL